MKTPKSRYLTCAMLAIGVALLPASEALAQSIVPPKPGEIDPISPLPAYIFGLLLTVAALALTAMPSKRTHED